jgi:hypothetical protein
MQCCVVLYCVLQIKPPSNVLLAHAVLMLLAFGVLLPTGLLLARHKWLFVDEEEVGLTALRCCSFVVVEPFNRS